jgi:hypothetical protein
MKREGEKQRKKQSLEDLRLYFNQVLVLNLQRTGHGIWAPLFVITAGQTFFPLQSILSK